MLKKQFYIFIYRHIFNVALTSSYTFEIDGQYSMVNL